MRYASVAFQALLPIVLVGCGGSGASPTTPVAPSATTTTSRTTGTWIGTFVDQDGNGSLRWDVSTEQGSSFAGTATATQNQQTGSGPLVGTINGTDLTFRFSLTTCSGSCDTTGAANLSGNVVRGTFQAMNAGGRAVTGQFILTRQS